VDEEKRTELQFAQFRRELLLTRLVGGALILVLFLLIPVTRQQPESTKTVESTEFILKDDTGHIIARLGKQDSGATCLVLTPAHSSSDARLCASEIGYRNSPYLLLRDNDDGGSLLSLSAEGNSIDQSAVVKPGLYVERDDLGYKFFNLSLGKETKLVIGHDQVIRRAYESPMPQDDHIYSETATVSIPSNKAQIDLFGPSEKPVWTTQK
jgi:hypothetical protein